MWFPTSPLWYGSLKFTSFTANFRLRMSRTWFASSSFVSAMDINVGKSHLSRCSNGLQVLALVKSWFLVWFPRNCLTGKKFTKNDYNLENDLPKLKNKLQFFFNLRFVKQSYFFYIFVTILRKFYIFNKCHCEIYAWAQKIHYENWSKLHFV